MSVADVVFDETVRRALALGVPGEVAHDVARAAHEAVTRAVAEEAAAGVASRRPGPFSEPGTSRAAALANFPRANTQRWRVLAAIGEGQASGRHFTREGLEDLLGLPGSSVRPRVWELVAGDFVFEVEGVLARTRFGNDARVLALTDKGRAALSAGRDGAPAAAVEVGGAQLSL